MKNETNGRGLRATLMSALVMGGALTYVSGCGNEDETVDPPVNPPAQQEDAGTGNPTDAGTDAGTGTGSTTVDSNLAIVRFTTTGALDTTYGTGGISRVDLGPSGTSTRDSLWGAARDATDRVVLFGSKKGDGERIDADRVVVRLTPSGALDESFATKGVHTLNLANLGDQARNGIVQPDGKIVASGYVSQPTGVGTQSANAIVLLRLSDTGTADLTFGSKGVVNSSPLKSADPENVEWGFAEAYGAALQSTGKYVTTGYGRPGASGGLDLVAFRYNADGKRDLSWGTSGSVLMDLGVGDERGRNLAVLKDDRVFMTGSGTRSAGNVDAMVVMFTPDGKPDTAFNADPAGYKIYDFGRADEAFFGAAVSPDGKWVAAAGHRSGGTGQNDDAILFIAPVNPADGSVFAQPVVLSATANDRFLAVAFDASNKVYASGFITENGDNSMVVARFNTNGTPDTTFGTNGVAKVNVVVGKTEEVARGLVIQSDGKIVLAGPAEAK